LERKERLNGVGLARRDDRRPAERRVLACGQAKGISARHQARHKEQAIGVCCPARDHRSAERISQRDARIRQWRSTVCEKREFVHRLNEQRPVSIRYGVESERNLNTRAATIHCQITGVGAQRHIGCGVRTNVTRLDCPGEREGIGFTEPTLNQGTAGTLTVSGPTERRPC